MKNYIYAGLVCVLLASGATGQTQEVVPVLTPDDRLVLQTLSTLGTVANAECQKLDSVKKYEQQRTAVMRNLTTKYPNYTIDFNTMTLVPKTGK